MTAPIERNRLAEEGSPYLQAHADNPVHWQPWDETALSAAEREDKPIFLSIGYAACHWCHVMAEESFEDDETAAVLNENFVPIKVDREERPDVDRIYQTLAQLLDQQGGWPLSVWLTPDGRPFYVGTYFPPDSRGGRPGFAELLEDLQATWENDREGIEQRADQWADAISGELEGTPDAARDTAGDELLRSGADAAVRTADREQGGFGSGGPKFPQPGRLQLLLRADARFGDARREEGENAEATEYRSILTETLDAMVDGGLYDHVGGGFHRYATDRSWTVPHFEKMLYDNAEIPRVLLEAYRATGDERYARVARETFDFLDRELGHPEGGFYSTLDARSEGEEGKFYVWTPAQVREVIDDETDVSLVCERYGITEEGNFEDGQTVLTIAASVDELAARSGLGAGEVRERLDRAREELFDARSERTRPPRDEKILAGWNGLAISALAEGSLTLGNDFLDRAVDALEFVRETLWDDDAGLLKRRYIDGDVRVDGYLEDYAFLARGALDCYGASGDLDHLAFALDLAREIETRFFDKDVGTLYFTEAPGESRETDLLARPQELTDRSTPSSAGVAVDVLVTLDEFVPHDRFGEIASAVLETHHSAIAAEPLQHASLVLAGDRDANGSTELTVASDEIPAAWRDRIGETYLPARVLARRPPTEAGLETWLEQFELGEAPPIFAGRLAEEDATIYACRDFTCSRPLHDVEEALSWFDTGR
ncbi:thioredoxin domain containing protein [Halorhabdus tiamatea SARL4B]|uniref:Thioredoxin domain containing protein n=1 Tax=Halorhabdus tiamatea SARL4B TaxID=1033806 RepID=F7PKE7_9EURY|nr:thioredoxin domain-containing protein [Halorhabdus tiamatea]ERJ07017.1 thioredoxin domain containing protein [Halorhabdus tiamatea SARL4B]CCQ34787.1 thymidylate kinase [Halorhabdus tiamatea SARL4B]